MLVLQGEDWELPQIGKEPLIGYEDEFIEKKMISGKIRRVYRGKRLRATFKYAFLTQAQRQRLNSILMTQRSQGEIYAEFSTPFGDFKGNVVLELNSKVTRFMYSETENQFVWVNFEITVKGVNYA